MQCYQRQAMYLKLNSDAVLKIPQLEFDPLLLDEVLSDFSIEDFHALITLNKDRQSEIIARIESIICTQTPREKIPGSRQNYGETKDAPIHSRYRAGQNVNRLAS